MHYNFFCPAPKFKAESSCSGQKQPFKSMFLGAIVWWTPKFLALPHYDLPGSYITIVHFSHATKILIRKSVCEMQLNSKKDGTLAQFSFPQESRTGRVVLTLHYTISDQIKPHSSLERHFGPIWIKCHFLAHLVHFFRGLNIPPVWAKLDTYTLAWDPHIPSNSILQIQGALA